MGTPTVLQTSIARAAHVAHAVATAAVQHIPDDILAEYWRMSESSDLKPEDALAALKELAETYGYVQSHVINDLRRDIVIVAGRLSGATDAVLKKRLVCEPVTVFLYAMQVAACALMPGNLQTGHARDADCYLAMSLLFAGETNPEFRKDACRAIDISEDAWPVFVALVKDGQDVFQAAEAAEMLTHR